MQKKIINIIVFVLVFAAVAGVLAAGIYAYRVQNANNGNTDDGSLYNWEGEYVDTTGYLTSMSIGKTNRKGFYDVSICMGESNSSDMIFWTFTASYDKESDTLIYGSAVRKDWINVENQDSGADADTGGSGDESLSSEEADGSGEADSGSKEEESNEELVINEVYTNGSGNLSVRNGTVHWTDDKEDFGKNLVFEKSGTK